DVIGERLPQLGDPRSRAVAGPAVADRLLHRLDDVRSEREIEIAEVEREDLVALRLPIGGGLGHAESGLGAEVVQAASSLHRRLLLRGNTEVSVLGCPCVLRNAERNRPRTTVRTGSLTIEHLTRDCQR